MDTQDAGAKFDAWAPRYEAAHAASVAASGENPEYFARYKAEWLQRRFPAPGPVLDYGCGIGNLTVFLGDLSDEVHGFDPSGASVEVARKRAPHARFHEGLEALPKVHFGLVVLSGVMHHVPPAKRAGVMADVVSRLRPGGAVTIFEHNPLNPLTRRAVDKCPFDDDAILLRSGELLGHCREAGLTALANDYVVFFPKALAPLRRFEPTLRWCPLGAQYVVSGRR